MKNFRKFSFSTMFCCLFAIANAQSGNKTSDTTAKVEPSVTLNMKANKLDKDGGQIVINQSTVENGMNKIGDLIGRRKQRKQAQANQSAPTPATTSTYAEVAAPTSTSPAPKVAPKPAPATADASYGGEWKMNVTIQEKYSNNGQRSDAPGACEIGMDLKIEGQHLVGEYTWAKGGVCGIAKIEGTMTGANSFEAVIAYSGGCCGGAKMKFSGTFISKDSISGKFKPDGLPGAWCETWWATVKGERE